MNKYKLTNETVQHFGRTLHRIRALRDFGDIKKGDLGGFVETVNKLSQEGNCWVYDDARVYGKARVSGKAQVYGDARVSDDARVSGNALVYGDARVCGNQALSIGEHNGEAPTPAKKVANSSERSELEALRKENEELKAKLKKVTEITKQLANLFTI